MLSVPCSKTPSAGMSRARKEPSGSGPVRVTTFRWTCDYDRETYAIRQLTSPEQRTALSPPTTNSFPHFSAIDSFDLPPTKPTHDLPFDRPSWSFTSNHLPIQWHPLPLLRRRRAAISKMRNHAMPVRNGTSTYLSACIPKAHLLAMRSPSPSPSHPVRRTTRDTNICANHLDF